MPPGVKSCVVAGVRRQHWGRATMRRVPHACTRHRSLYVGTSHGDGAGGSRVTAAAWRTPPPPGGASRPRRTCVAHPYMYGRARRRPRRPAAGAWAALARRSLRVDRAGRDHASSPACMKGTPDEEPPGADGSRVTAAAWRTPPPPGGASRPRRTCVAHPYMYGRARRRPRRPAAGARAALARHRLHTARVSVCMKQRRV